MRNTGRLGGAAVPVASVVRRVTRLSLGETPRGIRNLLALIGLYLLFPVLDVPVLGVSLSAPLLGLVLFEMARSGVRWGTWAHRPLVRRVLMLAAVLLLSWGVSLVLRREPVSGFDVALGLRLPYWVVSTLIVAVVVGRTRNPGFYLRVLGWGIMALGALRVGSAMVAGMWRAARVFALTQNTYGLLFSTFWPFGLVMATSEQRVSKTIRIGVAVLFVAILINGSRGSWVAVTATTSLYLLFTATSLKTPRAKALRLLSTLALLAVATAGFMLVVGESLGQSYAQRVSTFRDLDQDASYQTRVAMRNKAVALFRQSPVLGVGPARFSRMVAEFDVPPRLRGRPLSRLNRLDAHSAYFQFLAENGLLGISMLAVLLYWLGTEGYRTSRRLARAGLAWPIGFWLGFVGLSIHLIVVGGLLGTLPWFVYGLLGGSVGWERIWIRAARQRHRVRLQSGTGM